MSRVRYSRKTEADLDEIVAYTRSHWGETQASRYLQELQLACNLLAEHPQLGRPAEQLRTGLRRLEQGSHVIFYRSMLADIYILRILPRRMIPALWRLTP